MKVAVFFQNGIGNFAMMMPALQAMFELFRNPLDVYLSSEWRDFRKSAVREICERWSIVRTVSESSLNDLPVERYDVWFYSPHGLGAEIERRLGPAKVPKPPWRRSRLHEVDHYMEIAESFGYRGPVPFVEFPAADGPTLSPKLRRPVIGLCNGSFPTKEWMRKRWPKFREMSTVLKRYFDASVVGVGGSNELIDVDLDVDFTGILSICETAKVLEQLDVLITTDTGIMHIADLMEKPLIALFASTLTTKNAPRNRGARIIVSSFECAPCQDRSQFYFCESVHDCMSDITVGDVSAVLQEILIKRGLYDQRKYDQEIFI